MANSDSARTAVPLNITQKLWLAGHVIPVIFFAILSVFITNMFPNINGQSVLPLLPIIFVVILLILVYWTSSSLRDLLSGVAAVEEDEILGLWHSHDQRNILYGQFARLGRMRMSGQAFNQGQMGQHYQVCYSPASGMVWSLESNG